jgi:hypothetical protein
MLMIARLLRRDEAARHRLRDKISRAHVERKHEIEILDFDVDKRRRPVGAGIVDQDVERRLRRNRLGRGVDVAHVERERRGCLPARANGLGRFLNFLGGTRGERHLRAGVGQRRGAGEPDAAPGAGHQRAPPVEAEGGGFGQFDSHTSVASTLPWRGRVGAPPPGVG